VRDAGVGKPISTNAAREHPGQIAARQRHGESSQCRGTALRRPALNLGLCELRTMSRPASEYPDDVTVYLVVNDFGSLGRAFVETDIAEADRETVIRDFLSGQYSNALRVVAFNTAEGWSRDVSEDIAGEVLDRAFDADDNLSEDTKRFHLSASQHVTRLLPSWLKRA
jgi:hypothetical protein